MFTEATESDQPPTWLCADTGGIGISRRPEARLTLTYRYELSDQERLENLTTAFVF